MSDPIRLLIVDDSAFMRLVLKNLLSSDGSIRVVAVAEDPLVAWEQIAKHKPHVLTLDVEMPRMDGLSFLERLMRQRPMPVVMVSSLTEAGCATTLRALELGAVDFVTKPHVDIRERLPELAREVIDKIKTAHAARLRRFRGTFHGLTSKPAPVRPLAPPALIAIGASTGGTEAIKEILLGLPADCPATLIVQHMPPKFTKAFADRLDKLCMPNVKEAEDGQRVSFGQVLIAPGDRHMRLARDSGNYIVRLSADAPVNRHRPSVDVLFHSCAEIAGAKAIGVLLTGMGEDGARGLLHMRQSGAATLAQDEASSVIFGMPKVAIDLGAVDHVVSLNQLAENIMKLTAVTLVGEHR